MADFDSIYVALLTSVRTTAIGKTERDTDKANTFIKMVTFIKEIVKMEHITAKVNVGVQKTS